MKRLFAAVGAALATTILMPSGIAHATQASPGAVRTIAFASHNNQLWMVNGDGTHLHQIAAAAGITRYDPSFNPTGKQIAFAEGGDVWVVSTAGGNPRQLTHNGHSGDVAWSPDGQWIAFVEAVDGEGDDIFRVRATGGNAVRVTYGAAHSCDSDQPAWSPDSSSIAYERESDGNPRCPNLGLVVQRLGHPGSVVVTGTTKDPSFTPSGNLVYEQLCPDVCTDQWVGYESAPDGTQAHLVVEQDCTARELCLDGMVGAPAGGRGWISNDQFYDENDPISDAVSCFYGAFQKNGTVTQTMPQFCLSGILAEGFDVA